MRQPISKQTKSWHLLPTLVQSHLPPPSPRATHFPSMPLPLGWTFIHFHSGWASSPFTQILLYMSNLTL